MIYKVLSHSLGPLGLQAKLLVVTITDGYTESHKYWDFCPRCDKDLLCYNICPYIKTKKMIFLERRLAHKRSQEQNSNLQLTHSFSRCWSLFSDIMVLTSLPPWILFLGLCNLTFPFLSKFTHALLTNLGSHFPLLWTSMANPHA